MAVDVADAANHPLMRIEGAKSITDSSWFLPRLGELLVSLINLLVNNGPYLHSLGGRKDVAVLVG